MGAAQFKTVRDALVISDSDRDWRWYDAFGPDVAKYITEFASLPVDDTTGDPSEFVNTITEAGAGDSTAVMTDEPGGALLITTAAAENDGYRMQLGGGGGGEWVQFNGPYPTVFSAKVKINDADQTDLFIGLTVTDTDALGAVTDGMYFRSVDGSATIYFVMEKDSVESATAVGTLLDDTWMRLEFYYDGDDVMVYVDDVLVATIADTDANFPDNEALRLTIEFLTGEGTANTCYVEHLRLIHIRG